MFAGLLPDPRLALVALSALILGAAVPLAIAWTRLLPEDAPPFDIEKPDSASSQKEISYGFDYVSQPPVAKWSRLSIVLLIALTVSFALQLPGIPIQIGFHSITAAIPQNPPGWIEFSLACFFLVVFRSRHRAFLL